jgi:hypothetical protein
VSYNLTLVEKKAVCESLCTTWKTGFANGRRSPLVTGNAPVTDQVLQISQER